MTGEGSKLWDADATWAVQEWTALYDPDRYKLLSNPNSSNTYKELGTKAKRAFEIIGNQLLHRVRDLLPKRDSAELIGAPEEVANRLVGPLLRCALDAVASAVRAGDNRGMSARTYYSEPLAQITKELEAAGSALRTAVQNEVSARLAQIDAATKATAHRTTNEMWERFYHMSNTAKVVVPVVIFGIGYAAGELRLFTTMWHIIAKLFERSGTPF